MEKGNLFLKALHTVNNAVFICNPDGIIVWVNDAFERLSGYNADEIVNKTTPKVLKSGRHNESHYKDLWDTIKAGKVWEGEVVNRKKNGKTFNVLQTITPIVNENNQIEYFIAIHNDITEFNLIKYALDKKTEQLLYAQKMAKIGYWHWDIETNQIEWSPNMYDIFEVDYEEFVLHMQSVLSLIYKDDVQKIITALNSSINSPSPMNLDYRINTRSGIKYIHSDGSVEYNEDKVPTGLFGVSQDVTLRKLNEINLEKQTIRLKNANRINKMGYWEWNIAKNEVVWSDELYSITDLPNDEIPSKDSLLSFVHNDDKSKVLNTLKEVAKTGNRYSITYRLVINNRIKHIYEVREAILKDNIPSYITGTVRDITDEYEADLKLNDQLKLTSGILEAIPNPVIYKNLEGVILGCNVAFEELVSLPEEKVIDKSLEEIFEEDEVKKIHFMDSKLIKDNTSYKTIELSLLGKDFVICSSVFKNSDDEIIGIVKVFIDISDRIKSENQIKWVASHDVLTGLSNRVSLNDKLSLEITSENTDTVMILLLDLDHFKDVNDTLGHDFGDMLLIDAAFRIRSAVRKDDFIARLGGDEFAVILTNAPKKEIAEIVAKKIIHRINEPFDIKGTVVHIGCSIGITEFPNNSRDVQELIKQADLALYKAKADGRGKYVFYEQTLNETITRRKQVEDAIRNTLVDNKLNVYYQPRIHLNGSIQINGAEALLRCDKLGDITTQEFIDVAESTGLINEIDQWMTKQAFNDWEYFKDTDLILSVNISPIHFKQACFATNLMKLVDDHNVDLNKLEFEITENIMMTDSERNLSQLISLSEHGFKFAIDDFGTGYSSLSYISRFPVETLKIDKSFVDGIGVDKEKEAIIKAVIGLCSNLEVSVLAEGVETQDQADFLTKNGCNYHQGYLYSKAVSFNDLKKLVIKHNKG